MICSGKTVWRCRLLEFFLFDYVNFELALFICWEISNDFSGKHFGLGLKAQRKKMHLKMLSAEVVCCKKLPTITDELSIEANSVDPEQTAPIGAVLIWVHTACHRGFLYISADEKQTTFVVIGEFRDIIRSMLFFTK